MRIEKRGNLSIDNTKISKIHADAEENLLVGISKIFSCNRQVPTWTWMHAGYIFDCFLFDDYLYIILEGYSNCMEDIFYNIDHALNKITRPSMAKRASKTKPYIGRLR